MAVAGKDIRAIGLIAAESLASKQYCPVKLSSTVGQVKSCSAVADVAFGLLVNDPTAGQAASIAIVGIAKAAVEANVSAGDYLGPSTTGRLKAVTDDNAQIVAYALEGATTLPGDIIKALVLGPRRY